MNRHCKGFSLIEIMVALAIGVLSMVVMLQIFSNSEGQKRTATGGADAQTNGATGLYLVERDVKMAGWGLSPNLYLGTQPGPIPAIGAPPAPTAGCTTVLSYCDGSATCGGGSETGANFSFSAVRIVDGAAGAPDTITVRYFENPTSDAFQVPSSANYIGDNAATSTLSASSNTTCSLGDLVLVSDATVPAAAPGTCTILQVTTAPVVPVAPANATLIHAASPYNNTANWPAAPSAPTSRATVSCFKPAADGPVFKRVFSIDAAQNLVKSDNTVTPTVANEVVASGIVDIQAQYGLAADQTQNVTSWVNASAPWDNPKPLAAVYGTTTAGRLQNIKAVRIALLARSAQFEKPNQVSGLCTATTAAMVAAWPKWNGVAVFQAPTAPNWACYRYKVFQTLVPLRNIIWANI